MLSRTYDVAVIGGGHAGCEAALACARLGLKTALLSLSIDSIALMPCNPSIGGTGKGHLVREVDALGGQMGINCDKTSLQSRMLNSSKGPAVHSLRAQADKAMYKQSMVNTLFSQENLEILQAEVLEIETINGQIRALKLAGGNRIECRAAVACCGVYLNSKIFIGDYVRECGPQGLGYAKGLTKNLLDMGFNIRRFKTGTPARVDYRSIDFEEMTPQYGDEPPVPFSFMTDERLENKSACYLTYTNEQTHKLILDNIHLSPMHSGLIHATGTRYCPSIEDKIVRFADKDRHQLFLEPEGLNNPEWYVQGFSTSLPEWLQWKMYRTVPGMKNVLITRPAYAIEYDCIDPLQLDPSLAVKHIKGLYFAGQINGTSGYEEAAAQGLLAGINAAMYVKEKEPLILHRDDSYIGVLVDDLTSKGTNEPYRMMTGRVEHRLYLRQDNADLRLTELSYNIGLASEDRMRRMDRKRSQSEELIQSFKKLKQKVSINEKTETLSLEAISKRPDLDANAIIKQMEEMKAYDDGAIDQAILNIRYEGYLKREEAQIKRAESLERKLLPKDIDYKDVSGLRLEAREKLNKFKPYSLAQASRISGVSPSDIAVLMVWLKKSKKE